jgi:WD40-like Beta Propeller Repeat
MRGLTTESDTGSIQRGFGWSPWTILVVLGIPTLLALTCFFVRIQPATLTWLFPQSAAKRSTLAVLTAFVLFCFYGTAGLLEGGPMSATTGTLVPHPDTIPAMKPVVRSHTPARYCWILAALAPWCVAAQTGNSPRLFAPGVISGPANELSPAFSPDGKMVLFTRSNSSASMILESHLVNGAWSEPQIASFSGMWRDLEAAASPDGSFLVFASNRPATAGGPVLDGNWGGTARPGSGGNLWRVDRKGTGWGEPERLPTAINQGTSVFSPSVTADGSIYFMQPDPKTGYFHLYRSQRRAGTYLPATPVGIGTDQTQDVDPAVAPDESFLVYSSTEPATHHPMRLKIVFRQKDDWSPPVDLGDEVNEQGSNIEARLGPDGKTLYFSTNTVPPVSFPQSIEDAKRTLAEMNVWANGNQNIWYVTLSPWLDSHPHASSKGNR